MDFRSEGIANVITTTPQPFFIQSIDTVDNRHSSQYSVDVSVNVNCN